MNNCTEKDKWFVYGKKADFNALALKHNISPITARIMINRGVAEEEFHKFLHGSLDDINDGRNMLDMELAADIIAEAVEENKKIRIVGDYDIDGVCSTYILLTGIKRIGGEVDYDIPDRINDGYGINERIIENAHKDGVELIVTCDNGISAKEAISLAISYGMSVVITDHHEVPSELPVADAIVDPKQLGDEYPFKDICGGLVAYKLVKVLYENSNIPLTEWEELIEFAAIATIGDIMSLRDENRIIVREGIKALKNTKNIGLSCLLDECLVARGRLSAYSIGFVIGPCLNASGRLESAKLAMELFMSESEEEATKIAQHLKELNDERKAMTERYVEVAKEQVEDKYLDDDILVIYLPDCHEAVAGIIAGRIKDYYHHPTIVLTNSDELGVVKGSARSIDSYNIFEELTKVSDLLSKFGGHKLAAGMSLILDNIDLLRETLNKNSTLTQEDFVNKVWIDVPMPLEYATCELVDELDLLEPFGQGNEKPVFAQKNVEVMTARSVGSYKNFVKLRIRDEAFYVTEAVIFADSTETLKALAKRNKIDILYYPKIDLFNGNRKVEIQIKSWK